MSKQLAIAASACVLTMAAFALSAGPSAIAGAAHDKGATSVFAAPRQAFIPF